MKLSLKEILELKKAQLLQKQEEKEESFIPPTSSSVIPSLVKEETIVETGKQETFSLSITLNKEQLLAKELAFAGKSFCLIGAAGTGKTTAQREIARSLLETKALSTHTFRIQGETGQYWTGPSIAFVAYTRIASGNLKRAIHKDPSLEECLLHNVTTIHNLLEYYPQFYWNEELQKESMRFIPKRDAGNPLDITHLVIEEASMVDLDLWSKLFAALRPKTQIIFIGDINQLPPVFGPSILNYALTQLPVVELTHVYRQKGDSTILENAHNILQGKPLREAQDFQIIRAGEKQHSQFKLSQMLGVMFQKLLSSKEYLPEEDIILSPFNKQDLGTVVLNNRIAQFLGEQRGATVFEIIAGMRKLYLAEGDKILYNKQVGVITKITFNGDYKGKAPQPASKDLTRFGIYKSKETDEDEEFALEGYENLDLDKMIAGEKEDTVRQASHCVHILLETGVTEILQAVGDFGEATFSLGYALTVHKAQGCEWRKVFIVLHKDHSIMAFRELLYTAVTRSREHCVIFAKDFMIEKAIKTQRIKGDSLKEKIEMFNSGLINASSYIPVTK
jgi:exodeoxyribonuclease V alpha subunit